MSPCPSDPIRICIGFDPRETIAYHVLVQSLLARASHTLAITPIALDHLGAVLTRPRDPLQSTDLAFARFLTPWLGGYTGWSLFMDCDMLAEADIAELWALRDPRYAVQVVKHDHRPREQHKFLGHAQTRYARKNWSSVMLFDNARCRALTPAYVNRASGLDLHQFEWLPDDTLIGALPPRWNFLVGYDDPDTCAPALLHFTSGGPWFDANRECAFAERWFASRDALLQAGLPASAAA